MPFLGFTPAQSTARREDSFDASTRLRILFILGALPAAAVALIAPKSVAMPLASLVSLAFAAAVALYAWRNRVNRDARGLTFWDLAGMLTLIGFGAGAISEPAAALELFGMNATK